MKFQKPPIEYVKDLESIEIILDKPLGGAPARGISYDDARFIVDRLAPRLCTANEALELAQFLFRAMKVAASVDRDIWLSDMTMIFMSYVFDDVVEVVKHPIKGIRAKMSWLPDPQEIQVFLQNKTLRRFRIKRNAFDVLDNFEKLKIENNIDAAKTLKMKRQMENFSRSMKGLRSMEIVEDVRERQKEINDYATHIGGGDYAAGLMIMMDRSMEHPPLNWREQARGWSGEIG